VASAAQQEREARAAAAQRRLVASAAHLTTGTQGADVRYGGSAPTRRCEATGWDWAKRANLSEARHGQLTNAALAAWFGTRRYTRVKESPGRAGASSRENDNI
jgi:hypothetical protein